MVDCCVNLQHLVEMLAAEHCVVRNQGKDDDVLQEKHLVNDTLDDDEDDHLGDDGGHEQHDGKQKASRGSLPSPGYFTFNR